MASLFSASLTTIQLTVTTFFTHYYLHIPPQGHAWAHVMVRYFKRLRDDESKHIQLSVKTFNLLDSLTVLSAL